MWAKQLLRIFVGASLFLKSAGLRVSLPNSPSVWSVFGNLASKTGACNLGQGFPDWEPPPFVLNALHSTNSHQYTRPAGFTPLVELLAQRYSTHLKQKVDPLNNIAVTVGASQALYLALISMLQKGDEVIMFDPYFELYSKQIALTKASQVFVPLGGKNASKLNPWALDVDSLRSAVTPKTKVLLLNSPHNPTGKVFSLAELQAIAEVVRENPQLSVISDEVYKYTIYDAQEAGDGAGSPVGHHHFARLPDMWDRTLTISSAGKTFSVTGWQVGWMIGPEKFVAPVQQLLPCVQFCTPTPMQEALSSALSQADAPYQGYTSYYEWLRQQFAHKRRILEEGLLAAGIEPMASSGGFFLMGQLPVLPHLMQENTNGNVLAEPYDWQYCRYLAQRHGVIGIPAAPFFSRDDYSSHYRVPSLARFAFCKRDETLIEATRRLRAAPQDYVAPSTTSN